MNRHKYSLDFRLWIVETSNNQYQIRNSNIYILLLLMVGLTVGCKTHRQLVATPRSFDSVTSEAYYSPQPETSLTYKRLLPDPINGLGQTNDPSLRVTDVEVTSKFTILHLTFANNDPRNDESRISFNTEKAHLISPDGKRRFEFIRAEGISIAPVYQDVRAGNQVHFTLYFEPIPADLNEFGLFECDSDANNICWNVRNIILPAVTPK